MRWGVDLIYIAPQAGGTKGVDNETKPLWVIIITHSAISGWDKST
jgi:hypothetical protein